VFQARISIPAGVQVAGDLARFYDRLSERLVNFARRAVALASSPSAVERNSPDRCRSESRVKTQHERDLPSVNLRVISPGYLPTVGLAC